MKRAGLVFFLLLAFVAQADYLKVSRSATIKQEPNGDSEIILNVSDGQLLDLLDEGLQQSGYYHVTLPNGEGDGWIYRTLVRRYQGDVASTTAHVSVASSVKKNTTINTATTDASGVEVSVIDVGAGLSCLAKLPNNKYFIFDAGRASAMKYINTIVQPGNDIELMVLSHTDQDHWGAVDEIVNKFKVKQVIRTDFRLSGDYSPEYEDGLKAIENVSYTLDDYNIGVKGNLPSGKVLYNKDGVKITSLCGFKKPEASWGNLDDSKANNSVSIVVKLEFGGKSILFSGDAVGLKDCAPGNECFATEKFILDNVSASLINSDVIIAPHHGADNGSCETFIQKVSPEYVIFSAGHANRHPREVTADRYISFGVDPDKIFRTDLGDHETASSAAECKQEWSVGSGTTPEKSGDDHVKITISKTGKVNVAYINP